MTAQHLRREERRPESTHSQVRSNPRLPPAAFPTLDEPRKAGETGQKRGNSGRIREAGADSKYLEHPMSRNQNSPSLGGRRAGNMNAIAVIDYRKVPEDRFDNYVASNIIFNPVYRMNMETMAGLAEDTIFTNKDLDDSDTEDTIPDKFSSSRETNVSLR